jgi:hypothetical protein
MLLKDVWWADCSWRNGMKYREQAIAFAEAESRVALAAQFAEIFPDVATPDRRELQKLLRGDKSSPVR